MRERITVQQSCAQCGNTTAINVETGEEHEMVFRLTPRQLDRKHDALLAGERCPVCHGQQVITVLHDPRRDH